MAVAGGTREILEKSSDAGLVAPASYSAAHLPRRCGASMPLHLPPFRVQVRLLASPVVPAALLPACSGLDACIHSTGGPASCGPAGSTTAVATFNLPAESVPSICRCLHNTITSSMRQTCAGAYYCSRIISLGAEGRRCSMAPGLLRNESRTPLQPLPPHAGLSARRRLLPLPPPPPVRGRCPWLLWLAAHRPAAAARAAGARSVCALFVLPACHCSAVAPPGRGQKRGLA